MLEASLASSWQKRFLNSGCVDSVVILPFWSQREVLEGSWLCEWLPIRLGEMQ